jgi:DEAD/DEAH box helicase domain-containing protein
LIPGIVASELEEAVSQFLRTAFPFANPVLQRGPAESGVGPTALIDELISEPGELFKGPYLDIKLPFRLAEGADNPFNELDLPFTPYAHQMRAFERLAGNAPASTIVATGTGSGKTECFMLPVLDDCLRRREKGIKTIIVYPMNALAVDQARRFAEEVAKLPTQLTVGLFVGAAGYTSDKMGADQVITDQDTLRDHPPDILLTNYKMLDFLLLRPRDQRLWRFNTPGVLKYLVVDELHTFDGAQGTDLACLIRRLRDRLDVGSELACVGTSATMGDGVGDELVEYASTIFASEFSSHAIIGEDRLSADEYLDGADAKGVRYHHWPAADDHRLDASRYADYREYVFHQARLWFPELSIANLPGLSTTNERKFAEASVELGELLHQHSVFHQLIRDSEALLSLEDLVENWSRSLNLRGGQSAAPLLESLAALIAVARLWDRPEHPDPSKWCKPFLQMRFQLWLRELRRMVCSLPTSMEPARIRFADDLQSLESPLHLPLLQCRECHLGAWGTVQRKGDSHVVADLQGFYQAWFGYSPQSTLLVPLSEEEDCAGPEQWLCTKCLRLQASGGECIECEAEELIRLWVPNILRDSRSDELRSHHDCPSCGARDSLAVLGYRATTLASVMTGKLFGTHYNDDHKLIAFSDSVQDAAHRAGFLGANTWRQVVRQAMTGWLQHQAAALSLRDAADLLPAYWRDRSGADSLYCGNFIAPNMLWHPDYIRLKEHGSLPEGGDLVDQVSKRLSWECFAEFGRRSLLGRSLERTGQAAVGLDIHQLLPVIARISEVLPEEVEALRGLDDQSFATFVLGWLHHMRQIGAIYDSVLDSYLANKGREYQLQRLPWMPGFGRSQRPPAAITLGHVSNTLEAAVLTNRDTWATNWLKKTLASEDVFVASEARQIYQETLEQLTKAGWLVEREAAGEQLWLIDPQRLLLERDSRTLQCDTCRHRVHTSTSLARHYESMPCLRALCSGALAVLPAQLSNAASAIPDPHRLVPSEHTSLLPADEREAIEQSFIYGDKPWDTNLLSATPTLEMGIDIGDLSTVLLCSVPPTQANYLQRIGRAGRRDGNALAVTVANGENHDLFFYQDPLDMMAGAVRPPGVFLRAVAVLERQLIAYCFDRWVASGVDEGAIPGQLRKVIDAVEKSRLDQFPYTLLTFVEENKNAIFNGFTSLFDALEPQALKYLQDFIQNSGERALNMRLVERLQQVVQERAILLKKAKDLKVERERLLKLPEDEVTLERIAGVDRERSAVLSLLASINNQPVLNFFTDEGLLPNYAFPEEGVTLRSVILRRKPERQRQEGDSAYDKQSYSFQRSAQAALGELAPESRFYAVAHELQIDQIDLQLSRAEAWRFCDSCHYSECVDLGDKHSACPRCGSPQWADSGQRHTVLKLRQVYSTADDRYDRIGDEAERREPLFFNRQKLVDIPLEAMKGGFRIKSEALPFGFEYIERVTLREVNFGPGTGEGNQFSVAGREAARVGFKLCSHCGTVQKKRPRPNEKMHAFTCKLRDKPELESPEDFLESLYLYRELISEGIRILLPLSEVAYSDTKLYSFIAALNLGLKKHFQGDVQHLEVTEMRDPPMQGSGEKVYLVLYDRIPGGSGYLKDLMRDPQVLFSVLESALESLTSCSCVDEEHLDGCYRCILAYRNSRNMPDISRKAAEGLLSEILALRDDIEPVETLSSINTNVLIESKLEQKFVDALANLPGAQLTKTLVNGTSGSLLTLPGDDERPVAWTIQHQVPFGPDDGVALQTVADLVLTPARAEDAVRDSSVVVYLDGLQYHHNIVADDVRKRTALQLAGYRVWSLGWDDLPTVGKASPMSGINLMSRVAKQQDAMAGLWQKSAEGSAWPAPAELVGGSQLGSFAWLARLLASPRTVSQQLYHSATFRGFTALAPALAGDSGVRQKIAYELGENAPATVCEELRIDEVDRVPGGLIDALGNSPGMTELISVLPTSAVQTGDLHAVGEALGVHLSFDDREDEATEEFKAGWRGFWHAANLLQYLPVFSMATRKSVADGSIEGVYQDLVYATQPAEAQAEADDELPQDWRDELEFCEIEPDILLYMAHQDIPMPECGLDLIDESGEVVVEGSLVELGWIGQKVAILQEPADKLPSGWRVIVISDQLRNDIEELISEGVFNG